MKNETLTFDKGFCGSFPKKISFLKFKSAIIGLSLFLLFFTTAEAQNYPKEIRGYKVHKIKISIKNESQTAQSKDDSEAFVTLGEPKVSSIFLTGITLEVSAEMSAIDQSGKVDFLTFNNFTVNGLAVGIEEYTESFRFEKNKRIDLPKPIKIFVGTGQALVGGLGEMGESKDEWVVTGTVFVFGKFKKMGFNFKRVIPVEVNVKIKNPTKSAASGSLPF